MPMRKLRLRSLPILLGGFLAISCSAREVQSTTMLRLNTEGLTNKAREIVQGRVVKKHCEWSQNKTRINTTITIKVVRSIKGNLAKEEVAIRQPGGVIGDVGLKVSGFPDFQEGEEVLVFLQEGEEGFRKVVGLTQGKFRIITDKETGRKILDKDERDKDLRIIDKGKAVKTEAVREEEKKIFLEDFIDSVKAIMNEQRPKSQ
jgi:hypothetical protein